MTPISILFPFLAALQVAAVAPMQTDSSDPFLVVVNSANTFAADEDTMKTVLGRLFLSDQKNWPDGAEAIVFARADQSAEQLAFRDVVLDKSETELSTHWLKMKQVNGESPPRAISSSRILLRQINMKPDAVSIITKRDFDAHAHAFDQVQVLFSFDGVADD